MGKEKTRQIQSTSSHGKHHPHKKHRVPAHKSRHGLFSKDEISKIDSCYKANHMLGERVGKLNEVFEALKQAVVGDGERVPIREEEEAFNNLLTVIRDANNSLSEMEKKLKPIVEKLEAQSVSISVKKKK